MPKYKVTIYAHTWAEVEVEATSREDAIDKSFSVKVSTQTWLDHLEPDDNDVEVVE